MAEVDRIGLLFLKMNPDLVPIIEKRKRNAGKVNKKTGKVNNIIGSLCSTVMQEKENMCLEVVLEYLITIDRIREFIVALCADGLMIQKDDYYEELLFEMETIIYLETGFSVKMSKKEMDEGYTNIDELLIENPPAFTPNTDFSKIDAIVNRLDTLHNIYKKSKFYNPDLKIVSKKNNVVHLGCKESYQCKLCDHLHTNGSCRLLINEVDDCYLYCHKKSVCIWKSTETQKVARRHQIETMHNSIDNMFNLNTENINVISEDSKYLGCDKDNKLVWKSEYFSKYLLL
jgi:hypothetical protein